MAGRLLLGVCFTTLLLAAACSSSVDTSKARSRGIITAGGIVSAEELRVAEYLNYYKQSFPSPVTSTLGLDLRLGNIQLPTGGGLAWLQVGIQARSAEVDTQLPLNLVIVVDRSGSMDSPEKMPYLKQSLAVFLRSLSPNDVVGLVAFSDEAEVIADARKVGDGSWIDNAVRRLEPGGVTNLNAGMVLGFKQAERNFDVRRNNRVILLTDGIANRGTTDPEQIAAAARGYNDRGIYLSTVGLGQEFNDALLIKLANQGKGAYHFIDSAAEMDKVFRQEVSGLVQKAASDVLIRVLPEPGVNVASLTGYEGKPPSGTIDVRMRDMGTGDSQVLLVHLDVGAGPAGPRPLAAVELRYADLFSRRDEVIRQTVVADASRMTAYDPTWDAEVLRNVTIQRTAEGLKEIDRLYKARRYTEAWQIARELEGDLQRAAQVAKDPQLVKDADLMRTYQGTLARLIQQEGGSTPTTDSRGRAAQGATGPQPWPTAAGHALEIE